MKNARRKGRLVFCLNETFVAALLPFLPSVLIYNVNTVQEAGFNTADAPSENANIQLSVWPDIQKQDTFNSSSWHKKTVIMRNDRLSKSWNDRYWIFSSVFTFQFQYSVQQQSHCQSLLNYA